MATSDGYASNDWMKVEIGKPEFQPNGPTIAMLPHQCDDWEIGDADDVRAMIKDLKKALKKLEANDGTV